MPVQITARRDGFRRLGIAHSASTVTYPDDRFSKAELIILKSEPNLIVIEVDEATDKASASDELSAAQARILELEAGMLTLNGDVTTLKGQLDTVSAQLSSVTIERDQLLAAQKPPVSDEQNDATSDKSDKKKG